MKDAIDEKNGLFGTNLAFKISPSWSLGQERKEGIFFCNSVFVVESLLVCVGIRVRLSFCLILCALLYSLNQ